MLTVRAHDGHYPRLDEVHVINPSIWFLQDRAQLERDRRKMRLQEPEIARRESCKKTITRTCERWRRHGSSFPRGGKSAGLSPKRRLPKGSLSAMFSA